MLLAGSTQSLRSNAEIELIPEAFMPLMVVGKQIQEQSVRLGNKANNFKDFPPAFL